MLIKKNQQKFFEVSNMWAFASRVKQVNTESFRIAYDLRTCVFIARHTILYMYNEYKALKNSKWWQLLKEEPDHVVDLDKRAF